MSQPQSAFKKIVWAVDAFEDASTQAHVMPLLGALARTQKTEVQPIFVLSPSHSKVPPISFEAVKDAYLALAESRMGKFIQDSDISRILPIEVAVNEKGSVRKDAQLLIERARSKHADLIVLATHARKGLDRLFMGSFAETLALYSSIPILTVNPSGKMRETIRSLLFPTNFAPYFRPAFERTVQLAKEWDAAITLFYQEPILARPLMTPEIETHIAQEVEWREGIAREWEQWACSQGVRTVSIIQNRPDYLVSSICALGEERNFDLVVMTTDATPTGVLLLGSATRQVLRQSSCPVLVLRVEGVDGRY
jgi:nucleotide-binding universal stress UspA family protein